MPLRPTILEDRRRSSSVSRYCARLAKDGLLYVCDRINDRFQVFRKDGTFVSEAFFEKDTRLNGSVSGWRSHRTASSRCCIWSTA